MKIAFMSAWNTTSGVCMHSEPIAKAFMEMGHDVIVFTFYPHDHHGDGITAENEDFVFPCFGTRFNTNTIDPRPFIENDYEILIVEDLGVLPGEKLNNLMPIIKKKAKVVHVVHENRPPDGTWFYRILWDSIVYFDQRQNFLKKAYPDAEFIPFPCYKMRTGDKIEARKKLGLPLNKKIVYSFSHRGYGHYYRDLPKELRNNTILLQVIREDMHELLEENQTENPYIIVKREKVITTQLFDDYLFASDVVILHKYQLKDQAVVSTTALQALGTGCPIFVPKGSDFFQDFKEALIHYTNPSDLNSQLITLLNDKSTLIDINKKAEKIIDKFSPDKIAKKFITLFETLLKNKP